MNFYSTHQVRPDIMLEVSEYNLEKTKEILWMSKLYYKTGEVIDLASIIAYSPEHDFEGFYDWDENYFYVILSNPKEKRIIEIVDLTKKEKIASKEEQELIFKKYQEHNNREETKGK